MHDCNNACNQRLLAVVPTSIMPRLHNINVDLSQVRLVDFDVCLKGKLRGFIYVQFFSTTTENTKTGIKGPKKKGKFDDGEYKYVVLAHKLCVNGIIIEYEVVEPEDIILM